MGQPEKNVFSRDFGFPLENFEQDWWQTFMNVGVLTTWQNQQHYLLVFVEESGN